MLHSSMKKEHFNIIASNIISAAIPMGFILYSISAALNSEEQKINKQTQNSMQAKSEPQHSNMPNNNHHCKLD